MIRAIITRLIARDREAQRRVVRMAVEREILVADLREARRKHGKTEPIWKRLRDMRNAELREGLKR